MRGKTILLAGLVTLVSGPIAFAQSSPPTPAVRAPRISSAAPPAITLAPNRQRDRLPPVPVRITLAAGSKTLWQGVLNVGEGRQARVNISEPMPAGGCDGQPNELSLRQIEFNIGRTRSPTGELYQLTARYVRPSDDSGCGGSRTVSIDQRFDWADGGRKSFEGDGGLKVVLVRE